jgi:hypothetical protein
MTKSNLLRYLTKSIFQKHPLSEGACPGQRMPTIDDLGGPTSKKMMIQRENLCKF